MNSVDFSKAAVGRRLKAYRERAGLTQDEVTELHDLGVRVLSGWEQGRVVPSDDDLLLLAGTYKTHLAILRYGEGVLQDAAMVEVTETVARAAGELERLATQLGVLPKDQVARDVQRGLPKQGEAGLG